MLTNVFPQTLATDVTQRWPKQRVCCVMLRLISADASPSSGTVVSSKHFLHPKEHKQLGEYQLKKRRDEWLTGRICAKIAAGNFLADDTFLATQLIIATKSTGRPFLTGEIPQRLHQSDVSLSHGAGYGLATVTEGRCGVDVEAITRDFHRIQEKFCSPQETQNMAQHATKLTTQQSLALLWTAKEASKKALSFTKTPGFLDLRLVKFAPYNSNWAIDFLVEKRLNQQQPQCISVIAGLFENISLAISITAKNHHA